MKLTAYLTEHNVTRKAFAKKCKVDPITVYRWETGTRIPRDHLKQIAKVTGGMVTANDFYDVEVRT